MYGIENPAQQDIFVENTDGRQDVVSRQVMAEEAVDIIYHGADWVAGQFGERTPDVVVGQLSANAQELGAFAEYSTTALGHGLITVDPEKLEALTAKGLDTLDYFQDDPSIGWEQMTPRQLLGRIGAHESTHYLQHQGVDGFVPLACETQDTMDIPEGLSVVDAYHGRLDEVQARQMSRVYEQVAEK